MSRLRGPPKKRWNRAPVKCFRDGGRYLTREEIQRLQAAARREVLDWYNPTPDALRLAIRQFEAARGPAELT